MLCAFSEETNTFWAFAQLGDNVCGHPKTTHGGMTAALVDDTLGGLSFMLKEKRKKRERERRKKDRQGGVDGLDNDDGVLVAPAGPAYTVQLDISYKKPVPAGSTVCIEATVESIEGRKVG
jgi:acyl-coenzyme A thioesterase PaaI-like protein